ncbi:hypothetical protein ARMGADRAFT_1163213 [Armillaria gallica]|uniref:Uncharacterized protein n=1 Tax=Armillaria gallica TaxID=47427 RepID=A0A2H3E8E1_ARMGA|nr:hypothetical protein ARMGADRAFT_1163213 [Armillaria gallica]
MPTNRYGRGYYNFLLERGYQLRPRYHPNKIPFWKHGKEVKPEDWFCLPGRAVVNDASTLKTNFTSGPQINLSRRIADSSNIQLTGPNISTQQLRAVLILDEVYLEDDPDQRLIIVMPFLCWFFSPAFETLHQVLDAFRQSLSVLPSPIFTPDSNIVLGPGVHA